MTHDKDSSNLPKKVFDFFVGCAQIVSTIIGVIGLIISFIALVWVVRNPNAVPQIINIISGEATATPKVIILPSDTPRPTYTPLSTYTPYPTNTPVPTNTVIPSPTFTPTLTPEPTGTKSPIGLLEGDELRDSRVSLKFIKHSYYVGWDGVSSWNAAIGFTFEFTNFTGETILLHVDQDTFTVTDSLGIKYPCWYKYMVYFNESLDQQVNGGNTFDIVAKCGPNLKINKDVTSFTIAVNSLSSLPDSTWIADVPR